MSNTDIHHWLKRLKIPISYQIYASELYSVFAKMFISVSVVQTSKKKLPLDQL